MQGAADEEARRSLQTDVLPLTFSFTQTPHRAFNLAQTLFITQKHPCLSYTTTAGGDDQPGPQGRLGHVCGRRPAPLLSARRRPLRLAPARPSIRHLPGSSEEVQLIFCHGGLPIGLVRAAANNILISHSKRWPWAARMKTTLGQLTVKSAVRHGDSCSVSQDPASEGAAAGCGASKDVSARSWLVRTIHSRRFRVSALYIQAPTQISIYASTNKERS